MEQTVSLPRFMSSSPIKPSANSRKRRIAPASQALQIPETTMEAPPPPLLSLPSFPSSLHDPLCSNSLHSVKQIHARIIRTTEEWKSGSIMDRLIQMYACSKDFRSAAAVFSAALRCGALAWSYLINAFGSGGRDPSELLEIFRELHGIGVVFGVGVLDAALRICAREMNSWLGFQIHAFLIKLGLDGESYLRCSMMDLYAGCGSVEFSDKLFEEAATKDSILWNKLVVLNVDNGMWSKSLELFHNMQFLSAKADGVTIAKVLHACGRIEALKQGKAIHGHVIRSGLSSNLSVSNSLITMYSKNSLTELARRVFESIGSRSLVSWNSLISCCSLNGLLDDAKELFGNMISSGIEPDLVTWNALISGHSHHGSIGEVFELFRRMQKEGLKPNSSSITSVLRTISDFGLLEHGKQIHGCVMRNWLESNVYVGTSLIDMYMKCLRVTDARRVFDTMKHKNVLTWNSLVSGYAQNGLLDEALELVKKMEGEGTRPNLTTWNGLISGYSMKGMSSQAMILIRQLKANGIKTNVISWTALISGCCQNGQYEDSMYFFAEMQDEGIEPNLVTIASLLRACAALALLKKGAELHCFATRKGFDADVVVATALVGMYSKSGSLLHARRIFKKIQNKNLASWNAMINGFAAYGRGGEAISLFDEMCMTGIRPDGITFTALLSGCRHSGLISEGWKYFDDMKNCYKVTPTLEHYTCMVDLLARGGYLDEAWDFIQDMPLEPDASVWGALLGGCRTYRNVDLAEIAAKNLFKLEPYNSANYLLMISVYAYENRWEDAENVRDAMHAVGVKSRAGWSWIQINQTVHVFEVDGRPHPDIGEIYFELYQLISEMRRLGYVPDTSCIVQNVAEDEKEKLLRSHTEKLAITYGLINTDKSTPIRVIKNTRVCNDCHMVAKYMSRISTREIFLRDGVRFHHFVDGQCSCNDYW
ncbi:pentatricopeptide repeat-containing protein At4g01030, mitochondrial [Phoenix dactylifera]|uniref:Pentatricopeptide repeat-containing protein At4g01030, mitochondrial n=1 Tax=Phoenix dactylifera TaxID=42345 RepID=A0A8B9AUT1_PHODC|nr:pentatricopeptide repeat-containing protein At4g01030, mitochondrial [Phoenix dactylifera]